MLRRTKAAVVGDEIPPREELTVFIPLTDMQRFWTYRLLTRMDMPNLQKIFIDKPAIKLEDETTSQKQPEATLSLENSMAPAGSSAAEGNRKGCPLLRTKWR
jgi:SWI/SNF-related matrix-associated actin-dependent regulator of chromatin subfamily A member 5